MRYNTKQSSLRLPEYGRTIQQMIDHCVTIEDRAERQQCAQRIAQTMTSLFPQLRDTAELKYAVWDRIAIMSNFQLDIEYPCEIIAPQELVFNPERLPYANKRRCIRHYGHYIDGLVAGVMQLEPGVERQALILQTAIHMKRVYLAWNKNHVDDAHIYNDMEQLLQGALKLTDEEKIKLPDARELQMDVRLMSGIKQRNASFKRRNRR